MTKEGISIDDQNDDNYIDEPQDVLEDGDNDDNHDKEDYSFTLEHRIRALN